jgi:glutamine amidotransferase
MIGIIDIGIGNVQSICNWLDRAVIPYRRLHNINGIIDIDFFILPGVGSMNLFMEKLDEFGWTNILKNLDNNVRILGICLGAQALLEFSDEDGGVQCLGLLKGNVKKINYESSNTGWSSILLNIKELSRDWIFKKNNKSKIKSLKGRVYFNHLFGIKLESSCSIDVKITESSLNDFTAVFCYQNIIGFQFHPEKSQAFGELLIKFLY